MPAGDRTGPMGQGPMTGRGAGFCAGNNAPGYGRGRGFNRFSGNSSGRGMGGRGRFFGLEGAPRGRGNWNYNSSFDYPRNYYSAEEELRALREQADLMQRDAAFLNDRIRELETVAAAQKDKV